MGGESRPVEVHKQFIRTPAALRPLYFVGGLVLLGIGILGLILPVLPGTIFLILALNAFRRSHPGLEHWMLYRTPFGPVLQDWDRTGVIKPRVKLIIMIMLWGSIIGSVMKTFHEFPSPIVQSTVVAALLLCASWVSWYVLSRPSAPAA